MTKVLLTKKPKIFKAEQFIASKKPWPDGVKQVGPNDYTIEINISLSLPIEDGSWIVDEEKKTSIYTSLEELLEIYKIIDSPDIKKPDKNLKE